MNSMTMLTDVAEVRHQALSPVYADFVRKSLDNPSSWASDRFDRRQVSPLLARHIEEIQPWPMIVQQKRHAEIIQDSIDLVALIRSIPERIFSNRVISLCNYLGIAATPDLKDAFGPHAGLPYCLARTDLVLTDAGPKVLECNMGPGIGGWQIYLLEENYRTDPHIAGILDATGLDFSATHPMKALMRHAFEVGIEHFPNRRDGEAVNVGLAVPSDMGGNVNTLMPIMHRPVASADPRKGKRFCFTDKARIDYRDGRVFIDEQLVHVVVALDGDSPVPAALVEANRAGKLLLLNGPGASLLGRKSIIAALSELVTSHLLAPAERSLVARTVPWTRRVLRDMRSNFHGDRGTFKELLLRHQSRLVLKPDNGKSGENVTVGPRATRSAWIRAVDEALQSEGFVVQEYCASSTFLAPHAGVISKQDLIWSVFVNGNKSGGSWVRMMPTTNRHGVLNSSRGATETIVLEHA